MISQKQDDNDEDDSGIVCTWPGVDDGNATDPAVSMKILREQMREVLSGMDSRERKIMEMRFALGADQVAHSLEEVGEKFSITREEIREMEAKVLEKIAKSVGVDKE